MQRRNVWIIESEEERVRNDLVASDIMNQFDGALKTMNRLIKKERLTKCELDELMAARRLASYAKMFEK